MDHRTKPKQIQCLGAKEKQRKDFSKQERDACKAVYLAPPSTLPPKAALAFPGRSLPPLPAEIPRQPRFPPGRISVPQAIQRRARFPSGAFSFRPPEIRRTSLPAALPLRPPEGSGALPFRPQVVSELQQMLVVTREEGVRRVIELQAQLDAPVRPDAVGCDRTRSDAI